MYADVTYKRIKKDVAINIVHMLLQSENTSKWNEYTHMVCSVFNCMAHENII